MRRRNVPLPVPQTHTDNLLKNLLLFGCLKEGGVMGLGLCHLSKILTWPLGWTDRDFKTLWLDPALQLATAQSDLPHVEKKNCKHCCSKLCAFGLGGLTVGPASACRGAGE